MFCQWIKDILRSATLMKILVKTRTGKVSTVRLPDGSFKTTDTGNLQKLLKENFTNSEWIDEFLEEQERL